ncbi:hypothetical protein U9M48_041885 [Paspalum notatum var. saurae]|uniref:Uncharacterized protein n=1 Tax=Paspalum notatum var. saurae TaxID=547442 RepID=A0AAQ3URP5_PASNO
MSRGGNNGAGVVVVGGEVHVERVEKLELVKNGTPSASTHGVAVPDVNKLAEDFIRRRKEKFLGIDDSNDQVQAQKVMDV